VSTATKPGSSDYQNPTAYGQITGEELSEAVRIRELFEKQQSARWRLATSSAADRAERLIRLKATILRRKEELFDALQGDFSKPRAEAELTELQPVLMELNHTIDHLGQWMRPRRVGTPWTLWGSRSLIRRESKGHVLILSPWNYPFNLSLSPFIAAVAAGNTVIMRPSDKVRRTSAFIRSLITESFPEEEAAVVTGPSRLADDLLSYPFDHILFTGSSRIGRRIMTEAAKNLTPVTLELGGQSPVIIDTSADVAYAAEQVVWGRFLNGGQTCVAPNHVYVPHELKEEFLESAKAAVIKSYGRTAEERLRSNHLASIVDTRTCERLADLIDATVERGARLVIGGGRDVSARRLEPTILAGVTETMPIMEDEIFGPVLPVMGYGSEEELLTRIRARSKPLALYIFSGDEDRTEYWLDHTTAGGTVVNNVVTHLGNPDLPFGGVGESGMGAYHGERGFVEFSHERSVMVQGTRLVTSRWFRPPYGGFTRGALGMLTKWLSR
jgi:aldehyde dehydrogenase (NAD+)